MQQQQKRKISDEGAKAFQEFADKTMYEIPADKLPSGFENDSSWLGRNEIFQLPILTIKQNWKFIP